MTTPPVFPRRPGWAIAVVVRRRARRQVVTPPTPARPAKSHVTVMPPPSPPVLPSSCAPLARPVVTPPPCQVLHGHFPRPGVFCVYGCDPLEEMIS